MKFFQVREKSANFDMSKGNLEKNGKSQGKVREFQISLEIVCSLLKSKN